VGECRETGKSKGLTRKNNHGPMAFARAIDAFRGILIPLSFHDPYPHKRAVPPFVCGGRGHGRRGVLHDHGLVLRIHPALISLHGEAFLRSRMKGSRPLCAMCSAFAPDQKIQDLT
jgi:hypothetical protein